MGDKFHFSDDHLHQTIKTQQINICLQSSTSFFNTVTLTPLNTQHIAAVTVMCSRLHLFLRILQCVIYY